ncbi:MAG TPA: hypothetical protein VFV20_02515, partial [Candidatus Limnocylindria bacterium]|nr:hypothetical protein [Candidatus Limnocylindria bacterium]
DAMALRITQLSGQPSTLKSRVVGPRIGALVGAIVERLDTHDRRSFVARVEGLLAVLARAALARAIVPRFWLMWTASALARSDAATPPLPVFPPNIDGYRRLRDAQRREPNAYTLAEIALRVAPAAVDGDGMSTVSTVLAEIPEPLRGAVLRDDLARIDRAISHLEAWWQALASSGSAEAPAEYLEKLVRSRFYRVLLDERAAERFSLEAKLIADLFPDQLPAVSELRGRVDALLSRARDLALDLLRRRSDAAWTATLARGEKRD